jgi:hypothetical protein
MYRWQKAELEAGKLEAASNRTQPGQQLLQHTAAWKNLVQAKAIIFPNSDQSHNGSKLRMLRQRQQLLRHGGSARNKEWIRSNGREEANMRISQRQQLLR